MNKTATKLRCRRLVPVIAAGSATLLFPSPLQAQNYTIDRHVIGGGGGTSSGGAYTVSGTIGQPFPSTLTGGTYSLTGGFWSFIYAVQTAGAPTLNITLTHRTATLSWSGGTAGFVLQETPNLATGAWTAASVTLVTNGGTILTTVNIPGGQQFYRLRLP